MTEISAGYFPDYDVKWDYNIRRRYKTKMKESVAGTLQRRRMFPASGSRGTGHKGGYAFISTTSHNFNIDQRHAVANFLDSMDGAFKAFYLFRRDRDQFTNYEIGSVAAQSSIIAPAKELDLSSVTVNDVSKTFSTTTGIGTGLEDRINFTAGSQTGVVRITGRFRERLLVIAINDEVVEAFIANVMNDNIVFTLEFRQV
jgi:hypothetical protein